METNKISLSVRNLVEFVLRSGDIDNRRSDSMSKNAMAEGAKLHRKIQSKMGPEYHPEVLLKLKMEYTGYEICLEGRADGIIYEGDGIIIDEIKTMYADVTKFTEPVQVHFAQALCYAYMFCRLENRVSIDVQLTYCNIETEQVKQFRETKTFEELEVWFESVISQYLVWAEFLTKERNIRQASIQNLEFPFEYRKGQRKIVVSVYKTILNKNNLYIQAPTGVGKTLSTVFPAVRAVGEEAAEKIFYLTSKTITRTVAQEAFRTLRKNGLHFKTVTITAKEKVCPCGMECNPKACPRAKGHYDRVNAAVFDIINQEQDINREVIERYAEEYQVCPFEMSLDVSNFVDGIICDYNYVFDPYVCLKRYFADDLQGSYVFLVDEAHNLVERAREMYSAVLVKEDFLACKKFVKDKSKWVANALDKCNKEMLSLKHACTGTGAFTFTKVAETEELVLTLLRLQQVLEKFLDDNREFEHRDELMELYFGIRNYLDIYELVDDNYVMYSDFMDNGDFFVKLFCVNPSGNLARCMKRAYSTILFSATLLPVNYYKEMISGDREEYAIYVDSPFDENKRLLMIANDVSSKYARRGREEYEGILSHITHICEGAKGNYMVFFPSYKMMQDIYDIALMQGLDAQYDFVLQNGNMDERGREDFLSCFQADRERTMLGFCVLGGIFSEGIDLKHERLIGSIIVGTGLPQVCNEREILKNYFDGHGRNGFDYSYRYPGMNKVLQAAGRVIRTDEDYGVIALLDERFLWRDYRELFPKEWCEFFTSSKNQTSLVVKNFWKRV